MSAPEYGSDRMLRTWVLQRVSLHPPARYLSLARFKTATFPLIVESCWMYFLAVVNASNPSIRTVNGGKFGQSSLFSDGSWWAWKVESADAPGVAAMMSGVREIVSSAMISSSSMLLRRRGCEGDGVSCPTALWRKPRIAFIGKVGATNYHVVQKQRTSAASSVGSPQASPPGSLTVGVANWTD